MTGMPWPYFLHNSAVKHLHYTHPPICETPHRQPCAWQGLALSRNNASNALPTAQRGRHGTLRVEN